MYGAETYTSEGTRSNDFMIGILCGAAVGAAIGLLLAPKSGAELRGQLAGSAERFRRKAGETYEHAAEAVDDMVNKGRQSYEKASGAVEDLMDRGRTAVQRGKEQFDEVRSTAADAGSSTPRY